MLQGTEGKLFRPMALTVLFALFGSLVLSMTLMPALASLALPKKVSDKDVWLVRLIKTIYQPLVTRSIAHPCVTTLIALIVVFVVSIPVGLNLGAEFMPRLEEGDLLVEAVRLPSASLEGSIEMSTQIEQTLLPFPEVKTVFCKTGRPEIANDVMGVHQTDVWVILEPPETNGAPEIDRDALIEEMSEVLERAVSPASLSDSPNRSRCESTSWSRASKPMSRCSCMAMTWMSWPRSPRTIERVLASIPGAVDVKADYQANLTTITIAPRRDALARYGIDAAQVMDVVSSLGG